MLDHKSLDNESVHKSFVDTAVERLEAINHTSDNSTINSQFVNAINSAATDTVPKKERKRVLHPWQEDTTLEELYEQRDLQRKSSASSELVNRTTKLIRKRARFLRDEHFKAEAEKINQFAINRE